MSKTRFEFPYDPTKVEIRLGTRLIYRGIYTGPWRAAAILFQLIRGAGIAVFGFFLAYVAILGLGLEPADAAYLYYGLAIGFAAGFLLLGRALGGRSASVFKTGPNLQGQIIRLDAQGIDLSNGRSQSHTEWRDISGILSRKGLLVLMLGNQGIVLPDRLMAGQDGGAEAVRSALSGWFATSQADVA